MQPRGLQLQLHSLQSPAVPLPSVSQGHRRGRRRAECSPKYVPTTSSAPPRTEQQQSQQQFKEPKKLSRVRKDAEDLEIPQVCGQDNRSRWYLTRKLT